jgi:hypothetical protein
VLDITVDNEQSASIPPWPIATQSLLLLLGSLSANFMKSAVLAARCFFQSEDEEEGCENEDDPQVIQC